MDASLGRFLSIALPRPFHAPSRRSPYDPAHRLRSDRDRPGLRVRLFRHPGLQGPPRGRLPRGARQLEPGHDHDRSGHGRPHLHRAAHAGDARAGHRAGEARRGAPHARRPDGPQSGDGTGAARDPRQAWRGDDRGQGRRHPAGRGSRDVQGPDGEDRPRDLPRADRAKPGRGPRGARGDRPAGGHPAEFHARRLGLGRRLQPRGVRHQGPAGSRPLAGGRGARRGVDPRLERIRDGGDAGRRRQRRCHLLDRKLRSLRRAHRRLDHRRSGDDAHRPPVSADARRQLRGHPGGGRRDRRLQHPVCRRSRDGADDRDRDEPPRQPLLGPGEQGDWFSDRQDRGQARRWLAAPRAAQRHHPQDMSW